MKMISFCNKKGGVGKTTLCKNVAYKLALDGAKVLLIDLDPQATLSVQFSNKNIDRNKSLNKIILSLDILPIQNLIQSTKYKNIDIIVGHEDLINSNVIVNTSYNLNNRYSLADIIYQKNQETFDSYDYLLIDYPPTIQELALNFLLISDLIVVPINSGSGSYKGIVDLQNTLNYICQQEKREIPVFKFILNNIKDDENTSFIIKLIESENMLNSLLNNIIQHSKSFIKSENDLHSIWENQYYWRQKQAYEELIKEIK
ncbi:ParA family protein [Spiroplasma poulsonii]|uniref:Chromosome partitioning protein ParA n=2 Tax=Spiroplasma poulsonii TaxID=2138 RepID=A0A2R6Y5P1_9MOLU|nr:ParA family protein [Spiroplasma poulsonii]PTQ58134.1 Chromosome partitioning protein ParA [Spiroplasma poulsonii]PWF94102.1 Chromosome partitioning protein ParA [Spiroplasma poulsonii]PWF94228.1 Chromosome partitioning protein ParA [Spiroplasma poulsonii]